MLRQDRKTTTAHDSYSYPRQAAVSYPTGNMITPDVCPAFLRPCMSKKSRFSCCHARCPPLLTSRTPFIQPITNAPKLALSPTRSTSFTAHPLSSPYIPDCQTPGHPTRQSVSQSVSTCIPVNVFVYVSWAKDRRCSAPPVPPLTSIFIAEGLFLRGGVVAETSSESAIPPAEAVRRGVRGEEKASRPPPPALLPQLSAPPPPLDLVGVLGRPRRRPRLGGESAAKASSREGLWRRAAAAACFSISIFIVTELPHSEPRKERETEGGWE